MIIEDLTFRKDVNGTIRCQCGEFELTFKQQVGSVENLLLKHAKTHEPTTVSMIDVP